LSSQLLMQYVGDEKEIHLLDETADAQAASISPRGNKMAFVYYKRDSLGDLCVMDIEKGSSKNCFGIQGEVESPLWLDESHIVFVKREVGQEVSSLVQFDISSKTETILERGKFDRRP